MQGLCFTAHETSVSRIGRSPQSQADGRHHPPLGHMYLRIRPVALSWDRPIAEPTPMGHEYCGIVEEVGKEVRNIKRGQFVVGSFATSDNTCVICRDGYQSSCVQRDL